MMFAMIGLSAHLLPLPNNNYYCLLFYFRLQMAKAPEDKKKSADVGRKGGEDDDDALFAWLATTQHLAYGHAVSHAARLAKSFLENAVKGNAASAMARELKVGCFRGLPAEKLFKDAPVTTEYAIGTAVEFPESASAVVPDGANARVEAQAEFQFAYREELFTIRVLATAIVPPVVAAVVTPASK
jgi:hypothetical protein